jgi:hypothetical protein
MLTGVGYRADLDGQVPHLLHELCVRLGFRLPPASAPGCGTWSSGT